MSFYSSSSVGDDRVAQNVSKCVVAIFAEREQAIFLTNDPVEDFLMAQTFCEMSVLPDHHPENKFHFDGRIYLGHEWHSPAAVRHWLVDQHWDFLRAVVWDFWDVGVSYWDFLGRLAAGHPLNSLTNSKASDVMIVRLYLEVVPSTLRENFFVDDLFVF